MKSPTPQDPAAAAPNLVWADRGLTVLGLAALALVVCLPVFPSGDGACHLYYSDVVKSLWRSPAAYDGYFRIKTWFPPYALLYYLLIGLMSFLPPVVAEKAVAALCVAGCLWGVRYLAKALGPCASLGGLFALPLIFSPPLYYGFYNFLLGTGLALGGIGFWIRSSERLSARRSLIFLALLILLAAAHPTAVMLFLAVCSLVTLSCVARTYVGLAGKPIPRLLRAAQMHWTQWAHLACGILPLFFVAAFTARDKSGGWITTAGDFRERLLGWFAAYQIAPGQSRYFRYSILVWLGVAGLALGYTVWHRRGSRLAHPFNVIVLCALGSVIGYLFIPYGITGINHIPDRLAFWACLLLAAALGSAELPGRVSRAILAFAVAGGIGLLALNLQWALSRAKAVAVFENVPAVPVGFTGAIIADRVLGAEAMPWWAACHHFRRSKSVLLNAPWTNLLYIMVGVTAPQPFDGLSADTMAQYLKTQTEGPAPRNPARIDYLIALNHRRLREPQPPPLCREIARIYGLALEPWGDGYAWFFVRRPAGSNEGSSSR
jgi:hypothetical protein